jgi:hypothetical protein
MSFRGPTESKGRGQRSRDLKPDMRSAGGKKWVGGAIRWGLVLSKFGVGALA